MPWPISVWFVLKDHYWRTPRRYFTSGLRWLSKIYQLLSRKYSAHVAPIVWRTRACTGVGPQQTRNPQLTKDLKKWQRRQDTWGQEHVHTDVGLWREDKERQTHWMQGLERQQKQHKIKNSKYGTEKGKGKSITLTDKEVIKPLLLNKGRLRKTRVR